MRSKLKHAEETPIGKEAELLKYFLSLIYHFLKYAKACCNKHRIVYSSYSFIFVAMSIPVSLQTFSFGNSQQVIYVPEAEAVQRVYSNNKDAAYWAKVWPAAVGLCQFLEKHPTLISDKTILELAAGVGLPGLYAAGIAKQVLITDREPQAIFCIQQSINHLQLPNARAGLLNWKDSMQIPLPEVVMLSDVNYEPAIFEELRQVLTYFLHHNIPVIISTPQRLVARLFINSLLPFCTQQWNCEVVLNQIETGVSVYVLGNA